MVEWLAGDYHRENSLQRWVAELSLERLDVGDARSLLDVGCGEGAVTARVAERVPEGEVLGVDPSHRMVEYAARTYPLPHLRFQVGDAREMDFEARFDLVVSFNALHWVRAADQPRCMAGLARALRPGGRTFLQFVGQGPRTSLEDVVQQVTAAPEWRASFADFEKPYCHPTPEEYGALAEGAGLRVEGLDLLDRTWDFGSREGFEHWCEATFVEWTSRLDPARHADFIAAVLDRYEPVAGPHTFRFYQLCARLRRPD